MQERRSRQRLPSIRVTARVGIKRGFLGRDWLNVRVLDFSNRGLAFTGDVPLEQDDSFQMSLRLSTETGDFVVEKANASVSNIRNLSDRRIYGVRFADDNPAATLASLERIEGIVKRYKELSSRIFRHRSGKEA
ncbi:PilZ domain-containing protein [Marinobacter sp. OP 3.4]|uniref:PilZ domain-containing protein n=1 Tax=Marinobacter sp. OP 3.4 TaxID=3076501 RepID=UPI002E1F847C